MGTQGLREVAVVLEQVLTDFGRRAADDPRRLKGLITDTLGAEASELHDAIEIVVEAAEAGIPQAALNDADRHALVDQARNHLSDPESAGEVVDIWIAALHVQDRVPTDGPTVAPPVEQTLAAGVPTRVPDSGDDPTQLPGSGDDPTKVMSMADEAVASAAVATAGPGIRARISEFTTERKAVVLSAAGILVLALGGVGAASMWSGAETTTTTTTPVAETTTSVGETTTTVEALTVIDHEEQVMSWGAVVNRHWEIDGDTLVKKVTVASDDEAIQGTVWEIFPETWGVDAAALTFNPSDLLTATYSNQTAVRLIFDLPANSSWSYEYSIPLPEGSDDPLFMENLLAEWELAMTEFLATPPPTLEITSDSPVDDQVTFRGTTTPGAEVQVDGAIIEVAEDGTFEHTVDLAPGDNLVTVRTVDHVRGQAEKKELTWTYVPPTTTTSSTSTTTTTKPTTTNPPPPPPPTNNPPVANNDSYQADDNGSGDPWTLWPLCNDSDPDGDPFTITSVTTSVGSAYPTFDGDTSCLGNGGANNAIVWEANGYLGTVTFTYVISDGDATDSATITFCVESPINPEYCT